MASPMSGLEGVVVAETELSHVDGEKGELWIRGQTVADLAARRRFEAAIALLWGGEQAALTHALGEARAAVAPALLDREELRWPDAAAALRCALASMEGKSDIELVAGCGVFVAAFCRRALGGEPIAPDPRLHHAADIVRMMLGREDDVRAEALASYLSTVSDHGMNASTFVARVIASTGAGTTGAVTGALCALEGPLHGGAPGPVLDMLDAIGSAERAAEFVEAELSAGRRIMGMGHRIYRVRDPRVSVLEDAIARMIALGCDSARLQLARRVEAVAQAALERRKPGRALKANVEFATAVLLEAVGLPRGAFTAMFAAGRIAGWIAHVGEQRRTGRLVRPASRYIGPVPGGEGSSGQGSSDAQLAS